MCSTTNSILLRSYKCNNKTPIFLPKSFYLRSFKYFIHIKHFLEGQFYFVGRLKKFSVLYVAKHCVTLECEFYYFTSL